MSGLAFHRNRKETKNEKKKPKKIKKPSKPEIKDQSRFKELRGNCL